MKINDEYLNVLACPVCKTEIILKNNELICTNMDCRLKYPVKEGIPVMLASEAVKIEEPKWKGYLEGYTQRHK